MIPLFQDHVDEEGAPRSVADVAGIPPEINHTAQWIDVGMEVLCWIHDKHCVRFVLVTLNFLKEEHKNIPMYTCPGSTTS